MARMEKLSTIVSVRDFFEVNNTAYVTVGVGGSPRAEGELYVNGLLRTEGGGTVSVAPRGRGPTMSTCPSRTAGPPPSGSAAPWTTGA